MTPQTGAPEVSLLRLYMMRALYVLMAVGLAFHIWPSLIHHANAWPFWRGVASSLLGAIGAMAVLGIRYPLKMLPLLFFELGWKAIWLIVVALPLWFAHQMDADTMATVYECLMGIIVLIVIPWHYVFATYVKASGDRWR
ncbi:MAG: hypothetical protein HY243_11275 [Proteobacteria bacterium]|nr:hypothetical protein [Pseudomonadota bacterium]